MTAKNCCQKGFQRYPFHCCQTSVNQRLDLCSLTIQNPRFEKNLASRWMKSLVAGIDKNKVGIVQHRHSLSRQVSYKCQITQHIKKTLTHQHQSTPNLFHQQTKRFYCLETSQGRKIIQNKSKQPVSQCLGQFFELFFFGKGVAHLKIELAFVSFCFFPWVYPQRVSFQYNAIINLLNVNRRFACL